MPNEGQVTFDVETMTAMQDPKELKEEVAALKAIAGQGDPAKVANLQRTVALVPIADLDDMILILCDYVDVLDPRVQRDPRPGSIGEAELLIAKIRGHIAGEEQGGDHYARCKYEQYCINYEKETNEMWGASSMLSPDKPLSYSEWIDAGRPYNHPDHKN